MHAPTPLMQNIQTLTEEGIIESAKRKMVLDHIVIQKMETTGSHLFDVHAAQKHVRISSLHEFATRSSMDDAYTVLFEYYTFALVGKDIGKRFKIS